jgi:hypothetical protein
VVNDWAKQRKAKLEAVAPVKRKKVAKFSKVPLSWATEAAAATNTRKAMMWVWLLHRSWERNSLTITVPGNTLQKYGITRGIKRRALLELEEAGLITVERRASKNPIATLIQS